MDGVRFEVARECWVWDRVLMWWSLWIAGLDGGGCSPRRLVAFWWKEVTLTCWTCRRVTDGDGVV
jgi:hypothetical protein